MADGCEVQILSRAHCRELLAGANIGRIILTARALPTAVPVSYALDHDDIVFRAEATSLSAAAAGTVVAFQVDFFDSHQRLGWSVVVTGVAKVLHERTDIAHVEGLGIPTWVAASRTNYVRLSTELIEGRIVGCHSAAWEPSHS